MIPGKRGNDKQGECQPEGKRWNGRTSSFNHRYLKWGLMSGLSVIIMTLNLFLLFSSWRVVTTAYNTIKKLENKNLCRELSFTKGQWRISAGYFVALDSSQEKTTSEKKGTQNDPNLLSANLITLFFDEKFLISLL